MPDIASIGHGSTGPISRPGAASDAFASRNGLAHPAPARPGDDRPAESADRVELSDHARYMDRLRELPGARIDRVSQVRAAIIEGTYDSQEKFNIAVDRLLQDLDLPTE